MQKKSAIFIVLAFLAMLYVSVNMFMSQSVSPLFSSIVYAHNKQAVVAYLQHIIAQPDFDTQFSIYTSQYGEKLGEAVFADKAQAKKQIIYYTELLKKNPNARDVLIKLALLYREDGNINKSTEYYKKARSIDPESL